MRGSNNSLSSLKCSLGTIKRQWFLFFQDHCSTAASFARTALMGRMRPSGDTEPVTHSECPISSLSKSEEMANANPAPQEAPCRDLTILPQCAFLRYHMISHRLSSKPFFLLCSRMRRSALSMTSLASLDSTMGVVKTGWGKIAPVPPGSCSTTRVKTSLFLDPG